MEVTGNVAAVLEAKGQDVFAISPDVTVFQAIQELAARNIGALLVIEDGDVIGVFSERDYTRKVALQGRSSKETLVREVISGRVVSVTPGTPVAECLRLMTANRIRHLPVLEGGVVVGVISIGDLVNFIMSAQRATIEQLHSYIAGGYPG
ncbi:MAG: CBS domain-containing protein [Verrucomicrobiales bacterium]|nr:CBS domain-containing protein [Verrucomicrobiales bacterium]